MSAVAHLAVARSQNYRIRHFGICIKAGLYLPLFKVLVCVVYIMDKKAVFFDIDGTLVPFEKKIPESTVSALKKLRQNGHLAVLCTGRTVPLIMPELLKLGFDGIVAGCGTYIEYGGKKIYSDNADILMIEKLAYALISDGYVPFLESWQGIYYYPELINDTVKPSVDYYKGLLGDRFMSVQKGMEVSKLYVTLYGSIFESERYAEFEKYFNIIVHGNIAIEIIPKAHNKATGMEMFLKAAGIRREDTFAIGDSMNDAEMLKFAQIGIVMGNAFEEVKKFADYITTDIDDNGIYNALKHFKLI